MLPAMGNTLAIHWAATTHGTWLHGDPHGSWRDGRLIGPDLYLEAECRARMSAGAVKLDSAERTVVANVFGAVVREQQHRVLAATVQATHIHLIVAPLREDVAKVVARFKYRSAAAVLAKRRQTVVEVQKPVGMGGAQSIPAGTAGTCSKPAETAGLYSRPVSGRTKDASVPRSLWTAGKFPVLIFDELHLVNAVEYVRDHNRRMGLQPDPFDWIDPLFKAGSVVGERVSRSAVFEQPRL